MKVIRPVTINDTTLISSNIPENDHPEWNSSTAYSQGDRVISLVTHTIYEALESNTDKDPATNPLNATGDPIWLNLGATNRWKMFDGRTQSLSSNPEEIIVELQTTQIVNSIALFGISAASLRITMEDSVEGIVYDSGELSLQDFNNITSWWTYYYEDVRVSDKYVSLVLPSYRGALITVTVKSPAGVSNLGLLALGNQREIGLTDYGTTVGIMDYSRKERDIFGNAIVQQRRFSETVDYDVSLETSDVRSVQRLLSEFRATPLVWIGDEAFEETIIYGYYKDFSIVISSFSISDCLITVEGLS